VWEERALALALGPGDLRVRLNAGRNVLLQRTYWGGEVEGTRAVVEALSELADGPDAPLTDALIWHVMEASWRDQAGDGSACRRVGERGLELGERTGVHAMDILLQATMAFGALADEDFATADRALARMAPEKGRAPRLSTAAWHFVAAVVALRRGDDRDALLRARAAVRVGEEAGHPCVVAGGRLTWAVAAARSGGAGPGIDDAVSEARAAGYHYAEWGGGLAAAALALSSGDVEGAERRLREVLPGLRAAGCMNTVWVSRAELADLCALAIERGVEAEFAARLASTRGLVAGPRARWLASWPWAVRVHALGGLRVTGLLGEIAARRGAQQVPLQLLKLLVAYGERGARSDQLADQLWPSAEGDDARHALETTIYRLRQILGDQKAVVRRGDRITLDAGRVFVDAWALEALAAKAGAPTSGDGQHAARLSAAAAELGVGELFGDDEDPRVAFARDRVRRAAQAVGVSPLGHLG
jgi:hypothetical protein